MGLDAAQPLVDAAPAGRDQVHEQCQIVGARTPLGQQVVLDPLGPADQLRREAAHLGQLPRDGRRLGPHALTQRGVEALGQDYLQFSGRL